ncbi:MAG: dUTP diphosphatase [Hyphomicrobiales bacterium]|nr:dUTP diphosphatase [Hyphomicrobiales bacterium]
MNRLPIPVVRLPHGAHLPLPAYATPLSAGVDLLAALDRPWHLAPGERVMVPTGLAAAIPEGFEGQVRPRSGLAARHGVTVLNSPGTVDADYRGEIKVILINLGAQTFVIEHAMRIAQLVIAPVVRLSWLETVDLPVTDRAAGGFGSTGTQTDLKSAREK